MRPAHITKHFLSFFYIWIVFISIIKITLAENPSILEIVKTNKLICYGNVDFIKFNEQTYLVAVGRSFIKEDTPSAKEKALKEAELNAQEGLTKFVYATQISSKEVFKTKTPITIQNGTTVNEDIDEDYYYEIIREKGEGILKDLTPLGKWKSSDGFEYFYAVGFLMK